MDEEYIEDLVFGARLLISANADKSELEDNIIDFIYLDHEDRLLARCSTYRPKD